MRSDDPLLSRFHLVREMYETIEYIKDFDPEKALEMASSLSGETWLMLTGEGSSRIFPAKNAIHHRLLFKDGPVVMTESSTDLAGRNLEKFTVIGASNSGRTKELVTLFRNLKTSGHENLYGLTCNQGSLLEKYSKQTVVVDSCTEKAVAASKSVIAQALFYDTLLSVWFGEETHDKNILADLFKKALDISIDPSLTRMLCEAETVYFAGNNNGVAEELTLKTNEIIRKKSAYLPGTYLLHGVEEVISEKDVIIIVDPHPDEFEKIESVYRCNIGTPVIAFSVEPTPFADLQIPLCPLLCESYIRLAAGWNLLVSAGAELEIDLDKPERARKIGNEATG